MDDFPSIPVWLIWLALIWLFVSTLLLAWLVWRSNARADIVALQSNMQSDMASSTQTVCTELSSGNRVLETALKDSLHTEVQGANRATRQELQQSFVQQFGTHTQTIHTALGEGRQSQQDSLQAFQKQLTQMQQHMHDTLHGMAEQNQRRMGELRQSVDTQMQAMQKSNEAKLEQMRQTVDEKLQSTLQTRLNESFQQVAQRLEQVHKGLGEMQTLAQGVGDLKHLLTNVKTRGMFGEVQLHNLLEQVFAPEQYVAQAVVNPGSREQVDFAIKLPGREYSADKNDVVYLPIDAKFPNESYERLLAAQQAAEPQQVEMAAKALEQRLVAEAKSISAKYVSPPHTTDFAILFLPSEGLYAEALRRPDLFHRLQREFRITLAGPTTLLALLNALQMGFKTLALEKRSSEVWQVLGAVKTEFDKFGGVLEKVKKQTQTVLNTLDQAQTRTNVMHRKLKGVEALPESESQDVLDLSISD